MIAYLDLHIHGFYSGGVSKNANIENISIGAKEKGLTIVGTGDASNHLWLKHLKEHLVREGDVYLEKNTGQRFFITSEVEDINRVHHLLVFPDFDSAEGFIERIKPYTKDVFLPYGGRPKLKADGEKIFTFAKEVNALIGPAHAFTPYFSLYAHFDSIKELYAEKPDFLELGLSADSYLADMIKELRDLPFLSNSDSHSHLPHRLGREFNVFELKDLSFDSFRKALKSKGGNGLLYNVGLNPKEGKYHCTACNRCYRKYSLKEAEKRKWKCSCGGRIKKGVKDRILELGEDYKSKRKYVYLIPLAEILKIALNTKSYTSKVLSIWRSYILNFSNEIEVLLNADEEELLSFNPLSKYVLSVRKGWVEYIPGGGGNYGKPIISLTEEEHKKKLEELKDQLDCPKGETTTLFDYL